MFPSHSCRRLERMSNVSTENPSQRERSGHISDKCWHFIDSSWETFGFPIRKQHDGQLHWFKNVDWQTYTHIMSCPFKATPLSWVSPYSQPSTHSLLSHTGYKYRLLLVQCYILLLNPRPFPVPHTHHRGRELQWRITGYLIRRYHKKPVATATAPCVSMATCRHVKVVHSPPLKWEETMTTIGEQWNSRQPEKRSSRRRRWRRMARVGSLTPAGHIWVVQDTSWEKWGGFRGWGKEHFLNTLQQGQAISEAMRAKKCN